MLAKRLQNEGLSRDDLLSEKLAVDNQIGQLKARLRKSRARAWTKGEYLPPEKFAALETTLANLKARSQEIQAVLGSLPRTPRPPRAGIIWFPQVFVDVAERELPKELFELLREKALAEMKRDDNALDATFRDEV